MRYVLFHSPSHVFCRLLLVVSQLLRRSPPSQDISSVGPHLFSQKKWCQARSRAWICWAPCFPKDRAEPPWQVWGELVASPGSGKGNVEAPVSRATQPCGTTHGPWMAMGRSWGPLELRWKSAIPMTMCRWGQATGCKPQLGTLGTVFMNCQKIELGSIRTNWVINSERTYIAYTVYQVVPSTRRGRSFKNRTWLQEPVCL